MGFSLGGLTKLSGGGSLFGKLGDIFPGGKALVSKDAEDAAKQAGKENAKYITAETAEQLSRQQYAQNVQKQQAVADMRASGFLSTGGTDVAYLKELNRVFAQENAWLQYSGQSRADIAKQTGKDVAAQLSAQRFSTLFKIGETAASAYFTGGMA